MGWKEQLIHKMRIWKSKVKDDGQTLVSTNTSVPTYATEFPIPNMGFNDFTPAVSAGGAQGTYLRHLLYAVHPMVMTDMNSYSYIDSLVMHLLGKPPYHLSKLIAILHGQFLSLEEATIITCPSLGSYEQVGFNTGISSIPKQEYMEKQNKLNKILSYYNMSSNDFFLFDDEALHNLHNNFSTIASVRNYIFSPDPADRNIGYGLIEEAIARGRF